MYNFDKHLIKETSNQASWITINAGNYRNSRIEIFEASYDLFTGMPGEILFLAYYGYICNDDAATCLAMKAYATLKRTTLKMYNSINVIGLYKGWGSIIFLNTTLYLLYKDISFLDANKIIFERIDFNQLIANDSNYGVIKGAAGFILAAIDYYKVSNDRQAIKYSIRAADYLEKNCSHNIERGIGWQIASKQPLSGLSHGSSGFALAFLRLFEATNDKKYLQTVLKCVEYENTLYDEMHRNWKDVRDHIIRENGAEPYMVAWSHGAGGIGLARLEMIKNEYFKTNDVINKNLTDALYTVIKQGFTMNLSLSVGSFGNIELLHNVVLYLQDIETKKMFESNVRNICLAYLSGNYNICYPIKSLGLMAGVTGIGYESLRLLYPNVVRSILVV